MKKPTGYILYQGPSVLDGQPIVVIATLSTANAKTGDMIQTWILRSDMRPQEAVNSGADISICGGCPHKHNNGGACYVIPWQGPTAVYKAWQAGKYPDIDSSGYRRIEGRNVRLGAYGDPAAVPFDVWQRLLVHAGGHTGYTHQAKHRHFDSRIVHYCMVSADTPKQAIAYQAKGWRTFRVKTQDAPLLPDEITCLNTSHSISCNDCLLCDGVGIEASIVIDIHGVRSKRYTDKYSKANNVIAVGR